MMYRRDLLTYEVRHDQNTFIPLVLTSGIIVHRGHARADGTSAEMWLGDLMAEIRDLKCAQCNGPAERITDFGEIDTTHQIVGLCWDCVRLGEGIG
jgi:hypothetical protein